MDQEAARRRTVLAPATKNSLNARPKPVQAIGKRKLGHDEDASHSFEATALAPSGLQRPVTFIPLRILSRSLLPLLWLDTSTQSHPVSPGFLFSATVDQFQDIAQRAEPCVLIVRLCPNGGLYAVETVGSRIYIACALSSWVNEEHIEQVVSGEMVENDLQQILQARSMSGAQQITQKSKDEMAQTPKICSPRQPKNHRGVMARMSILPPKDVSVLDQNDASEVEKATFAKAVIAEQDAARQQVIIKDSPAEEEPVKYIVQQQPGMLPNSIEQNIGEGQLEVLPIGTTSSLSLDALRLQYFETLYLSKTSLAYFAKGPLARARALVQGPESSDIREQLTEFYRDSILPSKKMDLKYKESILHRIEASSPSKHQDTTEAQGPRVRRKKTAKKPKLGKDGLYSDEEEYLLRWWQEREVTNAADLSREASNLETKNLISDLRTRESQTQLLLILEILILESLQTAPSNATRKDAAPIKTEPADEASHVVFARTPRKPKAKRDLISDLDTLVDKLCIWHTIGIDQLLASPDKAGIDEQGRSSEVKDKLRDFCADAIIPFYASRLPERCKMICRRLGGPEASPARPNALLKKSSSTSRLLPGATMKSRPRAVPRRTLERVLSEDQNMRHVSPPVLSRSSTTSLVPTMKREPSESFQRPASRGGMHKSVSFINREIDLVADAKVHNAKRRKLARLAAQKQELDAAIDALKRPNRTKVARGIMEDLERRGAEIKSNIKQQVQIIATPKRPESREQWGGEAEFQSIPSIELPAENPVIPSSMIRPRVPEQVTSNRRSSTIKQAVLSAIHETPSRGLFKSVSPPDGSKAQLDVPHTQQRMNFVQMTPATNRVRPDLAIDQIEATPLRMMKSQRPVLLTPLKKAEVRIEDVFRDAPVISEQAGKAMDRVMGRAGVADTSIYDSLGWNDDFE